MFFALSNFNSQKILLYFLRFKLQKPFLRPKSPLAAFGIARFWGFVQDYFCNNMKTFEGRWFFVGLAGFLLVVFSLFYRCFWAIWISYKSLLWYSLPLVDWENNFVQNLFQLWVEFPCVRSFHPKFLSPHVHFANIHLFISRRIVIIQKPARRN